jgi:hypothetical protein
LSLFIELKRCNVFRVAIAYAVVAWLLIEVSATTFPMLMLPEWTATFVTMLLMIGFPLALNEREPRCVIRLLPVSNDG